MVLKMSLSISLAGRKKTKLTFGSILNISVKLTKVNAEIEKDLWCLVGEEESYEFKK